MSGYWRLFCLCIATMLGATSLLGAEADPPRRVGRISLAGEGTLLRIGDSVASGTTALNWPLTTGALIETSNGARAEARTGSTALRIEGGTSLEFVESSDERIWLRLSRGSIILDIQNPEHAAEMVLDTPEGRLRFDAPGSYRADVAGDTSAYSTYSGAARIEAPGLTVRRGDRVLLLGGNDRNYLLGQAATDGFRQWAMQRAQQDARSTTRFVSPEMTGLEELERHGIWRETAEYGTVWFPQGVPPGWAPYRWGLWAWISPWGWTWIDQSPWGFAPFHYGRWTLIGGSWAWLPGVYSVRPVYAPALVGWLGQPGWNVSFAMGAAPAAGWYPLGPREAYHPHYRSSLQHARGINAGHVPKGAGIALAPLEDAGRHIHRDRRQAATPVPEKAVQPAYPANRINATHDYGTRSVPPLAATSSVSGERISAPAISSARPTPVRPVRPALTAAPSPRAIDSFPKNQSAPLLDEGGSMYPRRPLPTPHGKPVDLPQTHEAPAREMPSRHVPAAAPTHVHQQYPVADVSARQRNMAGAEGGLRGESPFRRVRREDGHGAGRENAHKDQKGSKRLIHDR